MQMNEIILQLKGLYNQIIDLTKSTEFDSNNEQEIYAACLQGTILEQTSAFILLAENQHWNTLPLVFRSLLEAYAHLLCLSKDVNYLRYMHANDLKQKKKIIVNAQKYAGTNPYYEDAPKLLDIDSSISDLNTQLAKLNEKGVKALDIWERFNQAGLKNEYDSIYIPLCQQAHHSLEVLKERHFKISNNEVQFLTFHKYNSIFIAYITTIAPICINSYGIISDLLELSNQTELEELKKKQTDLIHKVDILFPSYKYGLVDTIYMLKPS